MAVLKAGKFYVALDASYPRDRLKYMLRDSGAKLIVTDPNNIAVVREICGDTLDVIDFTIRMSVFPITIWRVFRNRTVWRCCFILRARPDSRRE